MPKIKQYVSQQSAPGPIEMPRANPDTMGAGLGRGLEKLGGAISQVADMVQTRNEQQETSSTSSFLADLQYRKTVEMEEALKSGDFDEETFATDLDDELDGHMENISTRAGQLHLQGSGDRVRAGIMESAYKAKSELAGKKAVNELTVAHEKRSATLQKNPASFDSTLLAAKEDLLTRVQTGQLPLVKAEELAIKLEKDLAQQAIRGWINNSPAEAKKQLDAGQWDNFIDGDLKKQLYGEQRQAEEILKTQKRQHEVDQEKIKKEKSEQFMTEAFNKVIEGSFTVKSIKDSPLDYGQKNQLLTLLNKHNDDKLKTDGSVFLSMLDRIHLPDEDPRKIKDESEIIKYAISNGNLSMSAINDLRQELSGRRTEAGKMEADYKNDFYKEMRSRLSNSVEGLIKDPDGDENFRKFRFQADTLYKKGRQEGKTAIQLLDPASPDYVGKNWQRFSKGFNQVIQNKAKGMRNSIPAVSPTPIPQYGGEDLEDYFQKVKKPNKPAGN